MTVQEVDEPPSQPDLLRRAGRVGPRVSLQQIRLWRATIEQQVFSQPETGAILDPSVNVESSVGRNGELFSVLVHYTVTAALEAQQIFTLDFEWVLNYALSAAPEGVRDDLTQEDLEAFGAVSAVFAAHPYARMFVQQNTGQMGLPPLVLDVVRSPLDAAPVGIGGGGANSPGPKD